MKVFDLYVKFNLVRNMAVKERIKEILLRYAQYNVKYFDAPIPISRILKKYFLKKEYEALPPR